MDTVQVETINPHQYRQKERVVGERYDADAVHLPLIKFMKWAKPVEECSSFKTFIDAPSHISRFKPKQQHKRNK